MKLMTPFSITLPTFFGVAVLFFFVSLMTSAHAARPSPTKNFQGSSFEITASVLQTKIDAINNRQGFDEQSKATLLKFYQSAQDNLINIDLFKAHNIAYKNAIKEDPEKTKKLQQELAEAQAKPTKLKLENFNGISTQELEQRLIIEKEKLSSINEQLNKLETELAVQQSRPQMIRQETVTAQQDFDVTQKKLETPDTTRTKLENEAAQYFLKSLLEARSAELKMLEIEAISNPARVEYLKTHYQLFDLKKNTFTPLIAYIESILTARRQQEALAAQNALTQAEQDIANKHPVLQSITRENIQYSRELQIVTEKINNFIEQKTSIDKQAADLDSDFKNVDKKIALASLSPELGKLLREQRRSLLTQIQETLQSDTIKNEIALISLNEFKQEEVLKHLANIDSELRERMRLHVDKQLSEDQRMMIQAELRMLMDNQKELLTKLYFADTNYLRTLGDFDFSRQQLNTQANKFAAYLDERLLWVRSSPPIDQHFIADIYFALIWLLSPINGLTLLKDFFNSLVNAPFASFLVLTSVLGLLALSSWLPKQLIISAAKVNVLFTEHFFSTLKALTFTSLIILPLPWLSYSCGWLLLHNHPIDNYSKAIGTGLEIMAIPLFFMQFFYVLFAPKGIVRQHFQWQLRSTKLLRKQLAWLRFIAIPCAFIIACTSVSKVSAHSDSLGRLALILSMLGMALFLYRILNPEQGLLTTVIKIHPHSWLARFHFFWMPAAVIMPLIIIGFAATGYYLSALELQQKLIITWRLIFLMMILHALAFRWLSLVNQQLALDNAETARKLSSQGHSEKHRAVISGEDPVLPSNEQLIDIPTINAQTLNLLNALIGFGLIIGFSMIWKNILPAFAFLEDIMLWQHQVSLNNQNTYVPITLTNLMLAGLYVFITVVAMRNFSGIMELFVFRRFTIETGSRYAINQLSKYVLFSIGFIVVANELGGNWSQVQWLVAALSVGLGFGLQEIFANMVSGIILLFERPIRVGDTVTVGDITGKVSRIQMRATTLMDWDQKELIVPNKTFITHQLVNWTLSDSTTRVGINVGIAYQSDIELAHKIMLNTVRSTPLVLDNPEPCVLFMNFGDNSLNFTIYVYVSELGHRLQVTHDLHQRLLTTLREHNIEIPLPQRDVTIREQR
ncbi:MAG: mechanosensitive ion channel protein MscS [Methylococcaceae bacterium]|nr:MAG: mechanosensitive ion channel protein MscS [Methylococcaceae bacterium]